MSTFLTVMAVWFLVAIFAGWVVAQCIGAMDDPIDAETEALLKRINKEKK